MEKYFNFGKFVFYYPFRQWWKHATAYFNPGTGEIWKVGLLLGMYKGGVFIDQGSILYVGTLLKVQAHVYNIVNLSLICCSH